MDRAWLEKLLFQMGKRYLGKDAGGLIARLMKEKGLQGALMAIWEASEKENPREYVGAMVKIKGKTDLAGLEKPEKYKCPKCWQWYPDNCECDRRVK